MKYLRLYLMIAFGWILLVAQAQNTLMPSLDSAFVSQPCSPEMSAMVRNILYPVSYATGQVNVSIPLFEIPCGEIKLPISLSYHSSGVKVNQSSGWVGQNWSLICEPMISRVIKGKDDASTDYKCIFDKSEQISPWNTYRAARNMINEQPDEYFYRLLDRQGEFLYVMEPKNTDVCYMSIPYQNIKIEQKKGCFFITDDKGVLYKFTDARESLATGSYVGWKAASIVSSNRMDSISFSYHEVRSNGASLNESITILDQFSRQNGQYTDRNHFFMDFNEEYNRGMRDLMIPLPDYWMKSPVVYSTLYNNEDNRYRILTYQCNEDGELAEDNSYRRNEYYLDESASMTIQRLCSISFPLGHVEFKASLVKGKNEETLDEMIVYSIDGEIVRRILFEYDNQETKKRSFLKKVVITGEKGEMREIYSFEYIDTQLLPTFGMKGMDYWGYFNGMSWRDGQSTVPYQEITTNENAAFHIGTNITRTPNERYMQCGALHSITYPAGSRDVFEYEGNRILDESGVMQLVGGLRIKRITSYNESDKALVRTFEYGANENGCGYAPVAYNLEPFMLERKRYYMGSVELFFSTSAALGVPTFNEEAIITARQRTYYANSVYPNVWRGGASAMYEYVTEYNGTKEENIGKTVYHYTVNKNPVQIEQNALFLKNMHDSWKYGLLLGKMVYENSGGSYRLQNKETFVYDDSWDFGMVWTAEIFNPVVADNQAALRDEQFRLIDRRPTSLPVGACVQIQQKTSTYDKLGDEHVIVRTKKYKKGTNSLLCASTLEKSSIGDSLITSFQYPEDSLGNYVYEQMFHSNIYAPIAMDSWRNGKLVGIFTPYKQMREGVFLPASQGIRYSPLENYKKRVSYSYDRYGNRCEICKDGKERIVILYGYKHQCVIARIENATYSEVVSAMPDGELGIESMAAAADMNPWQDKIETLRKRLPRAHVVSYTYKPLFGVSSMTGIDGKTIYFEYDELGRLIARYRYKENRIEVLDQYTYHYKTED